jgi:hypothetical protein
MKTTNAELVVERIQNMIAQKGKELADAEVKVSDLKRDIAGLTFVLGGDVEITRTNGSSRATKNRRTGLAANADQPRWTELDDQKIINFVTANGPIAASEAGYTLMPKFPNRTKGGIIQRIYRLSRRGQLRFSKQGNTPNARRIVEAAA